MTVKRINDDISQCPRCGGLIVRKSSTLDKNSKGILNEGAVIEKLAEYAHEAWSGWMKYMFEKSPDEQFKHKENYIKTGCKIIPKWACERWTRQANTNYVDLSKKEKESDRDEAKKILSICNLPRREVEVDIDSLVDLFTELGLGVKPYYLTGNNIKELAQKLADHKERWLKP